MSQSVVSIYRHLVKGLNQESLQSSELQAGGTLVGDRAFAFQFLDTALAPNAENAPWIPKTLCAVQRDWPDLARVIPKWNAVEKKLKLSIEGTNLSIEESTNIPSGRENLAKFFHDFLRTVSPSDGAKHPDNGPVRLIGNENFTTRYTDGERGPVSLALRETIRDIEMKFGFAVDERRFRLNIFLEGAPAWSELNWIGKKIRIGNCLLLMSKPIGRCPNIDVDQSTGKKCDEIFPQLKSVYGHSLTGIKGEVLESGRIQLGDHWELLG